MLFSSPIALAGFIVQALSAVLKLQKAEILSGMGNNMFMPLKEATRAEVAKIICLLLNEQTY